ncbi:MAG: hypothetical protein JWM61_2981, partial [Micrococcaceae bacterium]|nr:hypothetical protein [Micrococcaceae bacterium]
MIGPSRRWAQGLGRRAAVTGLVYGFQDLA